MFRYFGTKAATAPLIGELIDSIKPEASVADAFGGLGTIGAELRGRGHVVTTCDVLTFPHAFQIARLECTGQPKFRRLLSSTGLRSTAELYAHLNSRRAPSSWLVSEYSKKRMFFTPANAVKIAGVWHQIKNWWDTGLLSRAETAFMIASFLNSMDAVANTAGTYYAYLKHYHRKAMRPFRFEWLNIHGGDRKGCAILGDARAVLAGREFDILYLDPPYNKRDYSRYYHLPESLALLRQPDISEVSIAGVPTARHSASTSIQAAANIDYLNQLIASVKWRTLILHYAEGAIIPLAAIRSLLNSFGEVKEQRIAALGYTTKQQSRQIYHNVFVVQK